MNGVGQPFGFQPAHERVETACAALPSVSPSGIRDCIPAQDKAEAIRKSFRTALKSQLNPAAHSGLKPTTRLRAAVIEPLKF
jgi:hypothetical protein